MIRSKISSLLRKLRLLQVTDRVNFILEKLTNLRSNRIFKETNPEIILPPDYLIYESFQLNYHKFYFESINAATDLVNIFERHMEIKNKVILDWGCGPGRIIRHLPTICKDDCSFFGSDYNRKTVNWCISNLPGISFNLNSLEASLPYQNEFFDIIYGISVFTHLSEEQHFRWYSELYRVLKETGIMIFTTQGENFVPKLNQNELDDFRKGKIVVRGKVKEGHRTYSSFQPPSFMKELFEGSEILEHIIKSPSQNKKLPQDIWVIRKNTVT